MIDRRKKWKMSISGVLDVMTHMTECWRMSVRG